MVPASAPTVPCTYSGAIGSRVLAFAPQLPPHSYVRLTRRNKELQWYDNSPILHRELNEVPRTPHSPVVVYDPTEAVDHFYVTEHVLAVYPDANIVPLVHAGHTIPNVLKAAGVLELFVRGVLDHDLVPRLSIDPIYLPKW